MIENDMIKHTRRAIQAINSPSRNLSHKVLEVIMEILIIIVAVTLSIALHNWSAHRHDLKEEREFLTGLKSDLLNDIDNMRSSKEFYQGNIKGLNCFLKAGAGSALSKDSVDLYYGTFFNSTNLDPYIGRYEGLKSSGKFGIIENKQLLNDIINLHELVIKRIQYLDEMFFQQNKKLENLISQRARMGKSGEITNVREVVENSEFRILMSSNKGLIENNIIPELQFGIDGCKKIIDRIDQELK